MVLATPLLLQSGSVVFAIDSVSYGEIGSSSVSVFLPNFSQFPPSKPQADNLQGSLPDSFTHLKQLLEREGFEVRFQKPPQDGAYGLLDAKLKIVWIHPVVFDLGIAQPVLVHEAVHAAQACKGNGTVAPLNLDIEPPQQYPPIFFEISQLSSPY